MKNKQTSLAQDYGFTYQLDENEPFQEGFNIKTIIGALFVGFIMLPGAIYMGLVTGQSIGGAAEWVTIILFVEIAKRSFVQLKKQEIIILFWVCAGLVAMGGKLGTGVNLFGGPFGGLIWDQYLVQSPQAEGFGISHLIPRWVAPPLGSTALLQRNFFHYDWILPIVVLSLSIVLQRVTSLSLGYVLFRVTSDLEKLPFPLAPVFAGGATALADCSAKRETWRWHTFSTGAVIGVAYGLIWVGIPTLSGVFFTKTLMVLPIPFIELTTYLSRFLPATAIGLGTDLGMILSGFIIPFPVIMGTIISSASVNLLLNPLFYKIGLLNSWKPGMATIPTLLANSIDLWISVGIGTAIVVALVGFANVFKSMFKGRKNKNEKSRLSEIPKGRGDINIFLALAIWAAGTVGYVVLCHILVPDFPLWILIAFAFLWTPIYSYIGAKMIGLTGGFGKPAIPYLREGSFILSGYKGVAIWFAPVPMLDFGYLAQTYKQLELTRTKFGSFVKMTAAVLVIMMVCSFIFWSLIWRLTPIPSSAYPFVQKIWPFYAQMQCFWASSTVREGGGWIREAVKAKPIFSSIGIFSVLYSLTVFFKLPIGFFYGLVSGTGMWIHYAIPLFIGGLLSKYYFEKKLGTETWRLRTPVLLAGYACGTGLIGMTACAIALIAKAVTATIY